MEAVFSGSPPVPPQGTQLDVGLSGSISGRIVGSLRAIDYLRVRGELELRGTIETDNGSRIVTCAEGAATPRSGEPTADIAYGSIRPRPLRPMRGSTPNKPGAWVT